MEQVFHCQRGRVVKILIAIPTYKRPQFLPDCIASVMGLQVAPNIAPKAAVVDNDTEQTAKPFCDSLGKIAYPLAYLQQPKKGLSNARNMALEFAIAEGMDAVLFVDDDMRLPPDYLQQLINAMQQHGDDATRGLMRIVDEHGNGKAPRRASLFARRELLAGNGVLVGRRIFADMGLRFDARFAKGFEDGDYFYRAHLRGAKLRQINAVFDELRPPSRPSPLETKERLQRMFDMRRGNAHLRKLRGGIWRALWYVALRLPLLLLQIVLQMLKLPFSPRKSANRIADKLAGIAGLLVGPYSPSQNSEGMPPRLRKPWQPAC